MTEHHRIAKFFAPLSINEPGSFHLTDDAAVLTPPSGYALVITTDSVIEGTHVLRGATPRQYAQKLVRRNLSDLAAKGATPWRYTLNLHLPIATAATMDAWVAEFAATLEAEQRLFTMVLVGGDSTSGGEAVHTTMTCFGLLKNAPLLRSTAQVGDDLYVSGTIGDAALGLTLLQQSHAAVTDAPWLIDRYHVPQPRLALGAALSLIATACMDISDGLLIDAAKLAAASRVKLELRTHDIPRSPAAIQCLSVYPKWQTRLGDGDDYELLFTAPASARAAIAALAESLHVSLTVIGRVVEGAGMVDATGTPLSVGGSGWEHV